MTDGAAAQTREPLKNGGTRNLANPLWCFHGFRLCVIILTIFGVIMVFSSSSVNMIANGQSPWAQALKHPAKLQAFMKGTKQSVPMEKDFESFKGYLMKE